MIIIINNVGHQKNQWLLRWSNERKNHHHTTSEKKTEKFSLIHSFIDDDHHQTRNCGQNKKIYQYWLLVDNHVAPLPSSSFDIIIYTLHCCACHTLLTFFYFVFCLFVCLFVGSMIKCDDKLWYIWTNQTKLNTHTHWWHDVYERFMYSLYVFFLMMMMMRHMFNVWWWEFFLSIIIIIIVLLFLFVVLFD